MDRFEQLQTTARLREAVEHAKASYERAMQDFGQALELQNDLGAAHSDGSVRHAMTLQDLAFHEYHEALVRLNRFILDGKLPDEESVPEV